MAIYTHTRTGNRYTHLSTCKIKINDKWVEGVIYLRDGKMYVRTKGDFEIAFKKDKK